MQTSTLPDILGYLTDSLAAGGHLNGLKVKLFTAGPVLNPHMVTGDFTEAAYTGYAAIVPTFNTPFFALDGNGEIDSQVLSWELAADLCTPSIILGYYLTNTAGTVLILAEYFPTPKVLSQAHDAIVFSIPILTHGGEGTFSDLNP